MLGETIQKMRKQKGLTQAALADQLHVVRQTVSKWEKGLSVPDADALQQLAEALDVSVGELLGSEEAAAENRNEIAAQLAAVNEQLAIRNRRAKRIWKTIAAVLITVVVLNAILIVLGMTFSAQERHVESAETVMVAE